MSVSPSPAAGTASPAARPPSPPPVARARRVLALTSLGVFIVFLDTTVVNVAFDTVSRSFDAPVSRLVWVLNAYTLLFAAFLIPAGQLADQFGRKRLFQTGLLGFALASALCGTAPTLGVLVAARAAQGIFGAVIVPASLALLLPAFPPERRATAISTWGAMAAVATAIGPTLGALLIHGMSWRWVFWLNVPICLFAALWGVRSLSESRRPAARGVPDPVGVAIVAVAPALFSFAIVYGPRLGWLDARVWGAFALGVALIPALVYRSRRAALPALDLSLFRIRNFQASNLATLVFSVAFFAFLLSSLLFLQTVWHYSVLRSALAVSPSALITAVVASQAGRLNDRFGYRAVFAAGALCYSLGTAALALRTGTTAHWATHWLPTLILNGIGVGLALSTLNNAAAHALPAERFGVGTAINNTFRQLGAVLGVSIFTAVLGTPAAGDLLGSYHRVWWVLAAFPAVSAVLYTVAHREQKG
ncbi:MFS transporter [Streptomyces yunnanensis]|uniref:MFS transporter n=1 Tax=Streptomyces yunnanensis TaxID=156453 RepID=A0ABY8AL57_9ACTN|nr:MFS transporter [Streptomyces yunnanensis]WEB45346.1 MFS transporter [Streptomyces yunnanensis]